MEVCHRRGGLVAFVLSNVIYNPMDGFNFVVIIRFSPKQNYFKILSKGKKQLKNKGGILLNQLSVCVKFVLSDVNNIK